MPATKKVVNPEKELRGKKPYNRGGPNGLKKKSYQAKPKKLDEDEALEGAAALKKKLRDTLRLLSKNPKMPADVRLDHERRIEALNLQIAEKQVDQTEQKMATKYRMIKFFESKKADRKLKVFLRQNPDWEQNEEQKKQVDSLNLDLAYIQHFPKSQKYISLYPNENADDPVVSGARNEIREKIRVGLESGEVTQFVKAAREEVKAKIIGKDALSTEEAVKLTTEKINKSKKRARDDDDPLSSRAKATAEREKSKPKQVDVVEEESFFETVPKVVAAAEIKEPANKKTKAEAPAKQPKKDQPKKDQPKKEQSKKEQPKKEQPKKEQPKKEQPKKEQPKKDQPKKEQPKKEQPKKEQPKKNEKKNIAAAASPAATNDASTEGGEVKKLGKWAKKAIRAQSTFAAKEAAASESGSTPNTNGSTDSVAAEKTSVEGTEVQPEEEKKEEKKPEAKKAVAKKEQPVGKKAKAKKVEKKVAEKKVPEKKVPEKKVPEKKVPEKKVVEKKAEKKVEEKVEDKTEDVKQDAPKITTLKVSHDDRDESDSDNDDEPAAPVRKIVKIDESLLKELPEVPKRRGGRNLNKFRQ